MLLRSLRLRRFKSMVGFNLITFVLICSLSGSLLTAGTPTEVASAKVLENGFGPPQRNTQKEEASISLYNAAIKSLQGGLTKLGEIFQTSSEELDDDEVLGVDKIKRKDTKPAKEGRRTEIHRKRKPTRKSKSPRRKNHDVEVLDDEIGVNPVERNYPHFSEDDHYYHHPLIEHSGPPAHHQQYGGIPQDQEIESASYAQLQLMHSNLQTKPVEHYEFNFQKIDFWAIWDLLKRIIRHVFCWFHIKHVACTKGQDHHGLFDYDPFFHDTRSMSLMSPAS